MGKRVLYYVEWGKCWLLGEVEVEKEGQDAFNISPARMLFLQRRRGEGCSPFSLLDQKLSRT
jgi:hypothetical protein